MLPLSFSVYLLVRVCKKKNLFPHFPTLFTQIKRLLKSLVMVTAVLQMISLNTDQMWHLSVLTLFLKLISRPSLLTPKSKPLLKSLEYFFLYNWILINVSELLSRSVSVLANETSVVNVEATWHRSNLPQESSSDELFLYSTEDKTCRPTKQTQYLTVLTSLCPFPSVLCSLASFLSSDNADFGYSKENVQECMFFSLPFSRQAPKSVPHGTNAVVNGLRVKV